MQYFSTSGFDDGRKWLFEKRIFADEIEEKTKKYQVFILKGIFPEYEQKNTKIALKI